MGGKSGGGSQTVGYKYYMGMHLVICHSADAITEIKVGDRTVWSGGAADEQINIDAANIFGGEGHEGGVSGAVDVMNGGAAQGVNDYLRSNIGNTMTAFRGVLSLVLRRVYIAANNPYAKPWSVRVKRTAPLLYDDPLTGMNAASIIRECLTNPSWGMGYPDDSIGDSFYTASNTLILENFGLNLIWTRQQPIEDFVQIIIDHIGGVMYRNPTTGQFELLLIRGDYSLSDIVTHSADTLISVDEYQRAGWGETVNEISLVYTDAATFKGKTVVVQNLANIQAQGGVVSRKVEYPGITSADLAASIAMRDLRAASTPLAKVRLKANRESWNMIPGQVFRLSWQELKITNLILRITDIDYGTLNDGTIAIGAVEDVFSFSSDSYLAQNDADFIPPSYTPVPATAAIGFETPYWALAHQLSRSDLDYVETTDAYFSCMAATLDNAQLNYKFLTGDGTINNTVAIEDYAPMLALVDALPQQAADTGALAYGNEMDLLPVVVGDYGYLIDDNGNIVEAVEVLALDTSLQTISLARGVLDTVPEAHPAGRRLMIVNQFMATDLTVYAPGETRYGYVVPRTSQASGDLQPLDNGPAINFVGRQGRPYPPGRILINGQAYPVGFNGDPVSIEWSGRNRLTQTGYIVHQDESGVQPEDFVRVRLTIYGEDGITIIFNDTLSQLSTSVVNYLTNSYESANSGLPGGRLNNSLTWTLASIRDGDVSADGMTSWKTHRIKSYRAGYGINYGLYYGEIS